MLRKIIAGDEIRRSRFHDEQGRLAAPAELLLLPLRLAEKVAAKAGRFRQLPWWPTDARRAVEGVLDKTKRVVEFGSGMSTRWLAQRAGQVISVESDPAWFAKVQADFDRNGIKNVHYVHRDVERYLNVPAEAGTVDLVIVDGKRRHECVDWALAHLKPGGAIYLDNSDADMDCVPEGTPRLMLARRKIVEIERRGDGKVRFFRGFPPGLLVVNEGALAQLNSA